MSTHHLMVVGEAWGEEEVSAGKPFVGPPGRLLKGLLSQSGLRFDDAYATNVFNLRPELNDVKKLCGPKSDAIKWMPQLTSGKYVSAKYEPELLRLYEEIAHVKPNLILALGGTATWALFGKGGIRASRGTTASLGPQAMLRTGLGTKVLPTYHPTAVLREWTLRPIVLSDLAKARREVAFADVRRPRREVWIEPTLQDLVEFERLYIHPRSELSIDVETMGRQITCFGVAPDPEHAIVVPLFTRKPIASYWKTIEDEVKALSWIRRICMKPNAKIGQNFLYDLKFLWEAYGIPVANCEHDTMLAHHALQPEMEKGLGFLGSIYTDESSWKFMRASASIKREE